MVRPRYTRYGNLIGPPRHDFSRKSLISTNRLPMSQYVTRVKDRSCLLTHPRQRSRHRADDAQANDETIIPGADNDKAHQWWYCSHTGDTDISWQSTIAEQQVMQERQRWQRLTSRRKSCIFRHISHRVSSSDTKNILKNYSNDDYLFKIECILS